ncbi:unnamed protein product [Caenorhabditis angaria]|uniref:G-protein coupled receptors family 1 profile domain-containing protein n=1 Tax=Caenorhabditis angaria TaxID=860376 RepID=A0A9P1IBI6_9PELO|nr:unnamed protein product [Caenorhabditis angaria]
MDDFMNIFRIYHTVTSLFGCFANSLLIYVALTKTPKTIRTYSFIVINVAITDFMICVFNFTLMQRPIAKGIQIIYISYGPCSYFSSDLCFANYLFMLHVYTHSIWLLFVSFAYRFYVFQNSEPKLWIVQSIIIILYIPSILQLSIIFSEHGNEQRAQKLLLEWYPNYKIGNLTLSMVESIFNGYALYSVVNVCVITIPITIGIFILRNRILKKIFKFELNAQSKVLQLQLLKALTFQACIPVFYVFGVLCYFSQIFSLVQNVIPQYSMFCLFIFVPTLNPISNFVFIAPYRRYILSLIGKNQNVVPNLIFTSTTARTTIQS